MVLNGAQWCSILQTIIPHSLQETIFGSYQIVTKVYLDVDIIACYFDRLVLGD
jgi:riboflavin synthase